MKPSGNSASKLVKRMPMNCGIGVLAVGTHGTLGEVVLTIRGQKHYVWRAVDQEGSVLKMMVQGRGAKKAAQEILSQVP